MSSLGFVIEDRGHCRCVVWDNNGGVKPATITECALWDALHAQPPAVGVVVSDEMLDRAAVALFEYDSGDSWSVATTGERNVMKRFARIALTAALRTGGGASCSLGVGCEDAGVCYADAHGEPARCGRKESAAIFPAPASDGLGTVVVRSAPAERNR